MSIVFSAVVLAVLQYGDETLLLLLLLCCCRSQVNPGDRHGSTPLHLAAGQGEVEAMRLLVKHGADVEHQTIGKATPLHVAASVGQLEALKFLTQDSVLADLMAEDAGLSTPHAVANRTGHLEAVKLLEEATTKYVVLHP